MRLKRNPAVQYQLTLDVQVDALTFRLAFDIGSDARNIPGHRPTNVLKYETLVRDDDVGRRVVRQLDPL